MISLSYLETCRRKNLNDADPNDLKEIAEIQIDQTKPVPERILSFIEQTGNPYMFRVNGVPVQVEFVSDIPLQEKLEKFLLRKMGK